MSRYTVTLTQAHVRYTKTEVEVEAPANADELTILDLAQAQATTWAPEGEEDLGHLDVEIDCDHRGSISWRED